MSNSATKVVSIERAIDVVSSRRVPPVLHWLMECASSIAEPVSFHGGECSASEAVRIGFNCLREGMRSWGISSQEDLSQWLRHQGFPATRPGTIYPPEHRNTSSMQKLGEMPASHFSKAVYVLITVDRSRRSNVRVPPVVARLEVRRRRATGFEVPPTLPEGTWEQMDHVDLQETFLLRIPMLKSCPHFLRGRLRECFRITLRERCRAKAVGDIVAEEREWKAFGLVPTMLLNRPRGWGSIGRDEGHGRLWPTFLATDFGQTDFGQNRLWPNRLWPKRV